MGRKSMRKHSRRSGGKYSLLIKCKKLTKKEAVAKKWGISTVCVHGSQPYWVPWRHKERIHSCKQKRQKNGERILDGTDDTKGTKTLKKKSTIITTSASAICLGNVWTNTRCFIFNPYYYHTITITPCHKTVSRHLEYVTQQMHNPTTDMARDCF